MFDKLIEDAAAEENCDEGGGRSSQPCCDNQRQQKMVVTSTLLNLTRWALEIFVGLRKQMIAERIHQMICEKSFEIDYEWRGRSLQNPPAVPGRCAGWKRR